MKALIYCAAAFAVLGTTGCNDDAPAGDTTKPTVSSFNFTNGSEVAAGNTLEVRGSFNDDIELSEAFFEIHDNFAGHSHMKANSKHSDSKIDILTGVQDASEMVFDIPTDAASGPYHMEVSVLDKSGNRSDVKVFDFEITQPGQPVFASIPTDIQVSPGESFNVKFEVTDETDLAEIVYEIVQHGAEGQPPLFEGDIDLEGNDDKSFSFDQDFTASGNSGELEFIIRAFDSDENLSVAEIEIDVR